jgi:hypothetical protein
VEFLLEPISPADWGSVRAIYREGFASRNA